MLITAPHIADGDSVHCQIEVLYVSKLLKHWKWLMEKLSSMVCCSLFGLNENREVKF
jgi:hypothetical protein